MNPLPTDYHDLLLDLKTRIRSAQYEALKTVNYRQLELYWYIGRQILARQDAASWGKSIVERLYGDLQHEFPGMSGLSSSNLWRIRSWVLTYQDKENLAPLVREVGWSHNIVIMEKCKDDLSREFYLAMATKFGWTKNVLIHQIEKLIALSGATGKTHQPHSTT